MTIYATGNALGSTDVRDLLDNAQNLDNAVNDTASDTWVDRFGKTRVTLQGYENQFNASQAAHEEAFLEALTRMGFEFPAIPYEEGSPVEVSRPTQLISYQGNLYSVRLPATFPVVLSGTWSVAEASLTVQTDRALRQQLAMTDGSKLSGFTPVTPGARPTTVYDYLRREIDVFDVLTQAQITSVVLRNESVDTNLAIQALLDAAPEGSTIRFRQGRYAQQGAVGLIVKKSLRLKFDDGAVLAFNHQNATYLQTWAGGITLERPQIDGGPGPWVRTGNSGLRIRTNGAAVSGIRVIRPDIKNVSGAGWHIGWSDPIDDVLIVEPTVRNTGADGGHITRDTSNVTVIGPRAFDTGDDGMSIVGYQDAQSANPPTNITITDALSVRSKTRGLTIIGGRNIKFTGQSIDATLQGALVLQDTGTYNTYPPVNITIGFEIRGSGGNGLEIGANCRGVRGFASAMDCRGSRGILVGSGAASQPFDVNMAYLSAIDCDSIGVELGQATLVSVGTITAARNGAIGILGANTSMLTVGAMNAYNNNAREVSPPSASIDNIYFSAVKGFSTGAINSNDDRATPLIERTFDLANCVNGVIGNFNGMRGAAVNVLPNIQASNTNVRSSSEVVVGAANPAAADIPARGFYIATGSMRAYFLVGGAARYAQLT